MSSFRPSTNGLVLLAVCISSGGISHAAVTITATETMGFDVLTSSVVFRSNGSLNLEGLTFDSTAFAETALWPSRGGFILGETQPAIVPVDVYRGLAGPDSIGSGPGFFFRDFGDGDRFGVGVLGSGEAQLLVPLDYISGSPLFSTNGYLASTFASLGLEPGVYRWSLPNDSITLAVIPEPTSYALATVAILLAMGRQIRLRIRRRA